MAVLSVTFNYTVANRCKNVQYVAEESHNLPQFFNTRYFVERTRKNLVSFDQLSKLM